MERVLPSDSFWVRVVRADPISHGRRLPLLPSWLPRMSRPARVPFDWTRISAVTVGVGAPGLRACSPERLTKPYLCRWARCALILVLERLFDAATERAVLIDRDDDRPRSATRAAPGVVRTCARRSTSQAVPLDRAPHEVGERMELVYRKLARCHERSGTARPAIS